MPVCLSCGVTSARQRQALYCFPCIDAGRTPATDKAKQAARAQVNRAVMRGVLPRLDGTVACVDCGKSASDYDHRDYSKPLVVDPVCRSCNCRRGPGLRPDVFGQASDVPPVEKAA